MYLIKMDETYGGQTILQHSSTWFGRTYFILLIINKLDEFYGNQWKISEIFWSHSSTHHKLQFCDFCCFGSNVFVCMYGYNISWTGDWFIVTDRFIVTWQPTLVYNATTCAGVYLRFLVNRPDGQVLSKTYQPNCEITSLASESEYHFSKFLPARHACKFKKLPVQSKNYQPRACGWVICTALHVTCVLSNAHNKLYSDFFFFWQECNFLCFNAPGHCLAHVRLLHYLCIHFAYKPYMPIMQQTHTRKAVPCTLKPKSHSLFEGNQSYSYI